MGGNSIRCGLVIVAAMLLLRGGSLRAQPSADNQPDLPHYPTRFYDIYTDLDREVAVDLGRRMDAMYDEYQRRLARFALSGTSTRSQVYLFRSQRDYLAFIGEAGRNTGGMFVTGRNCLAAFLGNRTIGSLRRSLQHEAFHQFAHARFGENLPPWINEGMAQLFEEAIWTGDEFLVGQVPPWRLRLLSADLNRKAGLHLVPFAEMMNRTHAEWNTILNTDRRGGTTEYTQSWAMVHFLVNARDNAGREKFRSMFLDMLDLLHDGKTPDEAFAGAFPGGNVKGFQDRFIEFARELKPTPEAAMIERQEVLGDLLIAFKEHGRTYRNVSDFHRDAARVLAKAMTYTGEHGLTWETDTDAEAYFQDVHGQPLSDREMYFEQADGASLPDLVCRGAERFQLRTHFSVGERNHIQPDVAVEPVGR